MLALATAEVALTLPGIPTEDAHGAPVATAGVPALPYAGHRDNNRAILTDDGTRVTGVVWFLEPEAWPLPTGATITDLGDTTTWYVVTAQLQASGLGLDQVRADCVKLASVWTAALPPTHEATWIVGEGPPPDDLDAPPGSYYLDKLTNTYYRRAA